MTTTWEWTFRDAKVTNENGLTDVIKSTGYTLRGTRDNVYHEIGGETEVGPPNPETFVPFSSITLEEVILIVSSSVNVDALKAQIDVWFNTTTKPLAFNQPNT